MKVFRLLCLLLVAVWPLNILNAAPMPVPTYEEHKAFLYGNWKPNRPSAIMFIDPFCSYCKRAIPKLTTVQSYNLFVFWAPIFGDKSEKGIAPFFECAEPTSKAILDGVAVNPRAAPKVCNPNTDAALRQRNDAMVEAYNVQGVPSYFLQGQRTSLSVLQKRPEFVLPNYVQGVALPWKRYASAEVLNVSDAYNAAILFPPNTSEATISKSLTQLKPQYVFSAERWSLLCKETPVKACEQEDVQKMQSEFYQEIIALLGLQPEPMHPLVITYKGTLNNL